MEKRSVRTFDQYIYLKYYFCQFIRWCNDFNCLFALVGCWSSIFIRSIVDKFLNVSLFDKTFCGEWGDWDSVNRFDGFNVLSHSANRRVIEGFCGIFVLSLCFIDFSVDVTAFVIGMSQISSLFSSILLKQDVIVKHYAPGSNNVRDSYISCKGKCQGHSLLTLMLSEKES